MTIDYLSRHLQYAPLVGGWMYDEFFDGGVPGGIRPGHSLEEVRAMFGEASENSLPVRWVALEGGRCYGVVSLVENDLEGSEHGPWLAGLYVKPECRKEGVGRALIDAVKNKAREMGCPQLYLRTEFAGGYYRKLGWKFVENAKDQYGLRPEVFRWEL